MREKFYSTGLTSLRNVKIKETPFTPKREFVYYKQYQQKIYIWVNLRKKKILFNFDEFKSKSKTQQAASRRDQLRLI